MIRCCPAGSESEAMSTSAAKSGSVVVVQSDIGGATIRERQFRREEGSVFTGGGQDDGNKEPGVHLSKKLGLGKTGL